MATLKEQFQPVFNRMVQCEERFLNTVRETMAEAGVEGSAEKVIAVYKKLKLVKRDMTNLTYNVKHGAYWNAETLKAAAEFQGDL